MLSSNLLLRTARTLRVPPMRFTQRLVAGGITVKPPVEVPSVRSSYKELTKQSDQSMYTRHLRLEQIFATKKEYIFRITKNMRVYQWEPEEVETMFADLADSIGPPPGQRETPPYELNQLLVLNEPHPKHKVPIWEVADGQQRLVTLSLLFCVLRDLLPNDHELRTQIQDYLIYKDYKGFELPRVELREKHNAALREFMDGRQVFTKNDKMRASKRSGDAVIFKMTKNYYVLVDLVEGAMKTDPNFIEHFHDFLMEKVWVYLTIPEDYSVARRLVGGSRKGKDAEPIDTFKNEVILKIEREMEQDNCQEKWQKLEDKVSRPVLEEACILTAEAELGQRCKTNGEVDLFEAYLKTWIDRNGGGGKEFFDSVVSPAAMSLHELRNGAAPFDRSESCKHRQQLVFLSALGALEKTKTINLATFDMLRNWDRFGPGYVDDYLSVLERVGLLFATTENKKSDRYQRVLGMVGKIQESLPLSEFDLTVDEERKVLESLNQEKWGKSYVKKMFAAAVLCRLDAALVFEESQVHIDVTNRSIEHILPQNRSPNSKWSSTWSEEAHQEWKDRLGNLCILNGKKNAAASNNDFAQKKEIYGNAVFPLTREISKKEHWTPVECKQNHDYYIALCREQFKLGPKS